MNRALVAFLSFFAFKRVVSPHSSYSLLFSVIKTPTSGSTMLIESQPKKGNLGLELKFSSGGKSGDIFQMSIRLDEQKIYLNYLKDDIPKDQIAVNITYGMPNPFRMEIEIYTRFYRIIHNYYTIAYYPAKYPLKDINSITLYGDVDVKASLNEHPHKSYTMYNLQQPLRLGGILRIAGYVSGNHFSINITNNDRIPLMQFEVDIPKNQIVISRRSTSYRITRTTFFAFGGLEKIPFQKDESFDLEFVNMDKTFKIFHNGRSLITFPQMKNAQNDPDPGKDYTAFQYSENVEVNFFQSNFEANVIVDDTYNWF